MKCWKINKHPYNKTNSNLVLEAHTNNKIPIKKSLVVNVWHDWNNNWNTYSSKYPNEYDSKIYQGKNKKIAIDKAKAFMEKHDSCD